MPAVLREPARWGIGSAVLLALGSIGPWATDTGSGVTVTEYGLTGDGIFTIILASFAALLFWGVHQPRARVAAVTNLLLGTGGLAAVISGHALLNVNSHARVASPGWGLYLAVISSLAVMAFAYLTRRRLTIQAEPPPSI